MSRRSAVLLGLLLSAAMAGLTRTTWTTASAIDLAGTSRDLAILGGDAAPTVVALGLVGIAASLATSLSSAWIRLVTGPVLILVGLGAGASALQVRRDPLAASRSSIAESVGVIGGDASAQATAWPLAVLAPALGLVLLGVLVLRRGGRWPRSSRYRRTVASDAPATAFDPASDPAGAWDALSLGEDPTAAAPEEDDEDAVPREDPGSAHGGAPRSGPRQA